MSATATLSEPVKIDWKRWFFILLGIGAFVGVYYCPPLPDAIDPLGKHFTLSPQAKGAIAVFLLAAIWWVFEVVPIGITSLAIGALQALFLIRDPKVAFKDFMDPSVLFIFGSIVFGMVFTKTGLTKRIAYKMLAIVGEKTSMIYLGCFVMTAALTHLMAHTAVAATMFPLLMTIAALYSDSETPTRFGKGLFIGMAYVAGAGSIITLLGAARGAVALGFYKDIMNVDISFFELTAYMFPIGWLMTFLLWGFIMVFFKPEKARVEGLQQRSKEMYRNLGRWSRQEITVLVIVLTTIVIIALKNFVPAFAGLHKTGILLCSTCHVHWFLPVGYGCCQMDGGALAGIVQGSTGNSLYSRHGLFCDDYDQFYYECGSHCHLFAGGAGYCPLSWRGWRGDSLQLSGYRRNAFPAAGGGGTQRHCL